MEKVYKFSRNDRLKEYGIEKYFEEALKNRESHIKSLGIINSDEYKFYIFDNQTIHMKYANIYIEDEHQDKVMFSCDNESEILTLRFNTFKESEIPDIFIGKCMIKILEEYKEFVENNKDILDFKKVRLALSDNFYGENKVKYQDRRLSNKLEFDIRIDSAIAGIKTEVYNAEADLKEQERMKKIEKNPILKFLMKRY